ncbi:MAG: translation initiation factor IF-5A [Candidatus Nanoarchaeia archaeon]|nr:translation initiation factor IF-5A [Candidatus Nanoarchaeia archaeon]MDD5357547.1 translation initiation factor IF-5A [Candidatus Nanoarchaeia archaeon]MDD5588466.1 translation initiation factor IF-5A [Candidatus Nanoarchaeia archaeon]
MVLKIIDATEAKVGTNVLVDGEPCTVKKMDISKTGKHGHAKCRIEAVGIISGNKKVFVVPGHERLEVPLVDKRKGQVLSIGDKVSVMDLENFETLEVACPDEVKSELEINSTVEYWDIEGTKVIKRKL